MIYLLEAKPWYEVGASIATIISALAIVFIIIEFNANKNVRNIQLMHRCIDIFRTWFQKRNSLIDLNYLELLNEELFYFQKGLIEKKVAIEWIEGILDFIVVFSENKTPLNTYNSQQDVEQLDQWKNKKYFFNRINYFTNTSLSNNYIVPSIEESNHHFKKRQLAKELYKHIKDYKY